MVDYLILRYMNESLNRVVNVMEEPTMETGKDELPTRFDIAFEKVSFGYLDKMTVQDFELYRSREINARLGGAFRFR